MSARVRIVALADATDDPGAELALRPDMIATLKRAGISTYEHLLAHLQAGTDIARMSVSDWVSLQRAVTRVEAARAEAAPRVRRPRRQPAPLLQLHRPDQIPKVFIAPLDAPRSEPWIDLAAVSLAALLDLDTRVRQTMRDRSGDVTAQVLGDR